MLKSAISALRHPHFSSRLVFTSTQNQIRRTMSIFNTSRLEGKTVLITGASVGIGAATAKLFAKAGANLVLLARRADKLAEVKREAESLGKGKVVLIEADMQKRKSLDEILGKTEGLEVDILVNNAGMVRGREQIGANDDIDVMFNTNDFRTGVQEAQLGGREAYAGGGIYCATKHAVSSFNHTLLRELVNTPIRVCEIQPGMVETEFSLVRFRGDKSAADAVYEGFDPLTGDDIAEEIVWVASRPPHVNVAQVLVLPVCQATATINYKRPQ